ncbi:slit homolog 2 protein-like isoform X2 [Argonauta hians]
MEEPRIYWSMVIVIILGCSVGRSSEKRCPIRCKCTVSAIQCFSPSFPIHIPNGKIESLSIYGKLKNIPTKAIVYAKENHLLKLEVNTDCIKVIEPMAFSGKVKAIVISSKNLTNISTEAFSNIDCQSLQILDSNIEYVSSFAFRNINCDRIEVKNSNITTLATDSLSIPQSSMITLVFNTFKCINTSALTDNDITINRNIIHRILKQDSKSYMFQYNELFCDCTLDWFISDSYFKKDNQCFGPLDYRTKPVSVDMFSICNSTEHEVESCPVPNTSSFLRENIVVYILVAAFMVWG